MGGLLATCKDLDIVHMETEHHVCDGRGGWGYSGAMLQWSGLGGDMRTETLRILAELSWSTRGWMISCPSTEPSIVPSPPLYVLH